MFLDVQMPEVDGFAVVSTLVRRSQPETMPAVVFVTAHDEYALRAFEAHAIDYLLKPFSDERFQASLDRAIRHVRAGDAHALMSRMQALLGGNGRARIGARPTLDKIVVKGSHRVRLLPVEQISWIEADGMYVKLHTRDGNVHLHRGLLGSLDAVARQPPVRPHPSVRHRQHRCRARTSAGCPRGLCRRAARSDRSPRRTPFPRTAAGAPRTSALARAKGKGQRAKGRSEVKG